MQRETEWNDEMQRAINVTTYEGQLRNKENQEKKCKETKKRGLWEIGRKLISQDNKGRGMF